MDILGIKSPPFKRPIFLQMMLAGILSFLSASITNFFFLILALPSDVTKDIFYKLDLLINNWTIELIIYLPIYLSSLLCVHFMRIFKNVMYSNMMVIIESVIFTLSYFLIYYKILSNGQYLTYALLFSFIIVLYFAFVIKKIFFKRYISFQKETNRLEIRPKIPERVDITITIVTNIILLIPSLILVYTVSFLFLINL